MIIQCTSVEQARSFARSWTRQAEARRVAKDHWSSVSYAMSMASFYNKRADLMEEARNIPKEQPAEPHLQKHGVGQSAAAVQSEEGLLRTL